MGNSTGASTSCNAKQDMPAKPCAEFLLFPHDSSGREEIEGKLSLNRIVGELANQPIRGMLRKECGALLNVELKRIE